MITNPDGSTPGKFNSYDVWRVVKAALISGFTAGAGVFVVKALPALYDLVVTSYPILGFTGASALVAGVVTFAKRLIADNTKE